MNRKWQPVTHPSQAGMVGRLFGESDAQELSQTEAVGAPPGDASLRADPFELANQQHSEVGPRRNARSPHRVMIVRLAKCFDVFVESAVEGLRKPDPRIYHLVCERLDVPPTQAVFLDDIGSNLKSARALGMHTIKVETPEAALGELGVLLGLSFAS